MRLPTTHRGTTDKKFPPVYSAPESSFKTLNVSHKQALNERVGGRDVIATTEILQIAGLSDERGFAADWDWEEHWFSKDPRPPQ